MVRLRLFPKKEDQETRRQKWLRRGAYLLIFFFAYRLLLWASLQMVDEERIIKSFDEWLEYHLLTDVSVHESSANLKIYGEAQFTVGEIEIRHPNEIDFKGFMLKARPVKLVFPVSALWGSPCTPELRVRNLAAIVKWNGDGYDSSSLLGLCDPLDERGPPPEFPFAGIAAEKLMVRLKKSSMTLDLAHRRQKVVLPLEGDLEFAADGSFSGSMEPVDIEFHSGGSKTSGRIHMTNVSGHRKSAEGDFPMALSLCTAELQKVPVSLLNFLWQGSLPESGGMTFSGRLNYSDGVLALEGEIEGFAPREVVEGSLRIDIRRDASGKWSPLLARCQGLNLDRIPPLKQRGRVGWLDKLLSTFNAVHVQADEICLMGVLVREATLNLGSLGKDADERGLVLRGKRFGGGDQPPASPLGVDAIRWQPSGGKIEVIIIHDPDNETKEDAEGPIWSSAASIDNLSIPAKECGLLFRELANIPVHIIEVEQLRRQAIGEKKLGEDKNPLPLGSLIFSSVTIRHEIYAEGLNQFRIEGVSPDLGVLTGGGRRNADGTFSLALSLGKIPRSLFALNPALSSEIITAVLQQANDKDGLRLDLSVEDSGEEVKRRYVQDVFRVWTTNRAREPLNQDAEVPAMPLPEMDPK